MKVKFGKGTTEYGPGVQINLKSEEVALAILAYLVAKNTHISGAMTIRVNGEMIKEGSIYVDPSGSVVSKGKRWKGDGTKQN